jgi:hypothetical protein
MHIANDNQASVARVRRETLQQWIEQLLASERFGAAADDIRDAVASKIQLRARAERRQ